MVPRGGFYATDKIHFTRVEIAWDRGFDRDAKNHYVEALHRELHRFHTKARIAEVTTASLVHATKMCSPLFIDEEEDGCLEDLWLDIKVPGGRLYNGRMFVKEESLRLYLYLYCKNATHLLPVIRKYDIFTDVFYNPDKVGSGTQAQAVAVLQWMDRRNELDVLKSMHLFESWYFLHEKEIQC